MKVEFLGDLDQHPCPGEYESITFPLPLFSRSTSISMIVLRSSWSKCLSISAAANSSKHGDTYPLDLILMGIIKSSGHLSRPWKTWFFR